MCSCHVELFETKVSKKGYDGFTRKVPDLVGEVGGWYKHAERGEDHDRKVRRTEEETERRKRFDLVEDVLKDLTGLIHVGAYIALMLCWCICGATEVDHHRATWEGVLTAMAVANVIHLVAAPLFYAGIVLWVKRKLRLASARLAELREMGLVRTKREAEVVDNPWYQFAHHAATMREYFNQKAKAWNIIAEAIERDVFEMTDEMCQYHENLVVVREQVARVVNTAEFLVKYHQQAEEEGAAMSRSELSVLLAQIDQARAKMEAVFEIEEMPFDPSQVTARAKVALPVAAPPIDKKQLVQRALAKGRKVPC